MRFQPLKCLGQALCAALWLFASGFSSHGQTVLWEIFTNAPGSTMADVANAPGYPNSPAIRAQSPVFEVGAAYGDNYVARLRGYVTPSSSGAYFFFISGGDQCDLYLSPDESPFTKTRIAYVLGGTGYREWNRELSQKSASIQLVGGKRYYIEALQKAGTATTDSLSVGWQTPILAFERPLPANRFAPFVPGTTAPLIRSEPADQTVQQGNPAGFVVVVTGLEPMTFQWFRDDVAMQGETSPFLSLPNTQYSDSGTRLSCLVSNSLGTAISRQANLTVTSETNPPVVVGLNPPVNATVQRLSQIEVIFSEPVVGLRAQDLLVNGVGATSVEGSANGPFIFQFPPAAPGTVKFSWAAAQAIVDLALIPNRFAGGSWTNLVSPNSVIGDVIINEILAENSSGLLDEDGDNEDWIELYNRGTNSVDLANWSLTDSQNNPGQWVFPSYVMKPKEYLIVFASAKDRFKNATNRFFHANFKLSPVGEYLGLYYPESPRRAVSELAAKYPEQRPDISFQRESDGNWRYSSKPTPGALNFASDIIAALPPPHFSAERGVYSNSFKLLLGTDVPGATIRYTLDGSKPTSTNGFIYRSPIPVQLTAVVRAATFKTNYLPSAVKTHSYLFSQNGTRKVLPILSVVTDPKNLTGPTGIVGINGGSYDGGGAWVQSRPTDYYNPIKKGAAWERPVSMEFIQQADNSGFQTDAGIRVHASDYFRPRLTTGSKFSYVIYFRGDYGASKLEYPWFAECAVSSFNEVVLRAGSNEQSSPFLRDEFARRLMADEGQVASHGNYVHLYINGVYKGFYNPVERIEAQFMQEWHGGAKPWDVVEQSGQVIDGTRANFQSMLTFFTGNNLSLTNNYEKVRSYLDTTNFVDYLLVNVYAAMGDWPGNNWRAAREISPEGRWRFYIWDGEFGFGMYGRSTELNTFKVELTQNVEIPQLYQALVKVPEFRLLFADRAHKHFFNDGALTDAKIIARYNTIKSWIAPVFGTTFDDSILNSWIPARRRFMSNYMAQAGVLLSTNAPVYSQFGGRVGAGFRLSVTNRTGTIYYTTNGADPRVIYTGAVSRDAQSLPSGSTIALYDDATVVSRSLIGTNLWSAATVARFQVDHLDSPVKVTEIMNDPSGGDAYQFVEIYNDSLSPFDLSGASFEGIQFQFPLGSILPGQGIWVLGSNLNPIEFARRYPGVAVQGRFGGSLARKGEDLTLRDGKGQVLFSVHYGASSNWLSGNFVSGHSFEFGVNNGSVSAPENWIQSPTTLGTPGKLPASGTDSLVRLSEIVAFNGGSVVQGTNLPDWVELWNPRSNPATIAGWTLRDSADHRFTLPSTTTLGPDQRLLVFFDDATNSAGLHTGFGLNSQHDGVYLFDSSGVRIDGVTFGNQVTNVSLSYFPGNDWQAGVPTPGAPNALAGLAPTNSVVLNELVANSLTGSSDWLELFNTSSSLVADVSGYYVGVSNLLDRVKSRSFIAPNGFLVLTADDNNGWNHLAFKLPATGGTLRLLESTGIEINRLVYPSLAEGIAYGRYPDGGAPAIFTGTPTPGLPNFQGQYNGPILSEFMAWNVGAVRQANGRSTNWFEIRNDTGTTFDLGGFGLALGSPDHADWIFPPGSTLRTGSYIVVWCDPGVRPSTNYGPNLEIGRSLDPKGDRISLLNRLGQVVDTVLFGPQMPNRSIARYSTGWDLASLPTVGTANALRAGSVGPTGVKINEWRPDAAGSEGFVELYNFSLNPMRIDGLFLTDDLSAYGTLRFKVPPLTFIPPQGVLKFVADSNGSAGLNHLSFKFSAQGANLRLYNANYAILDTVESVVNVPKASQGRWPDGSANIQIFGSTSSGGDFNYLLYPGLLVNELLTHTDSPLEDAIEFYNSSDAPIDISGWYLSNASSNLRKVTLPAGTIVPARGYKMIYENQFNDTSVAAVPFTFNSAHGDSVWLTAADASGAFTGYRATADFGAAQNGVPFGRYVTSVGVEFVALSQRTFGADNPASLAEFRTGTGRQNADPLIGPVVISEVMYHPPDLLGGSDDSTNEFIELVNLSTKPVPVFDPEARTNAWHIDGGVRCTFGTNLVLAPGEIILLVNYDPALNAAQDLAFRGHYQVPAGTRIFGPYAGKLGNATDSLELYRPDPPQTAPHPDAGYVPQILVEHVVYGDGGLWPTSADGTGFSLQRYALDRFGNEPLNWAARTPTAGRLNFGLNGDADADGMPDQWELEHNLNPLVNDAHDDPDGDGLSNLQEYFAGTDPHDATSNLTLRFQNYGGQLLLSFTYAAAHTYSLLSSTNGVAGTWTKVADFGPYEAPGSAQATSDLFVNSSQGAYFKLVTPQAR